MKNKVSNLKSKEYYREAESLQKGWGKTLKYIDVLKDKVNADDDVSLKDACYILYLDGWCSYYWEKFYSYSTSKKWTKRKMPWLAWNALFNKWYNTSKDKL